MNENKTHQQRVERARRPNPVKADRAPVIVYRCRLCKVDLGRDHLGWCDPDTVAYLGEVL